MNESTVTPALSKSEWDAKKAKFEYFGSILGLLAACVTLSITVGGIALGDNSMPSKQNAEVVHHVLHFPFLENLVSEAQQASPGLMGEMPFDMDALRSEIPTAVERDIPTSLLAGIGLAIGILVWSVVVIFRRPREMDADRHK